MANGANSGGEASFLENHVEKLALGICVLLLVFAVTRWVPKSPREAEVLAPQGSTKLKVAPDDANENLRKGADAIWLRIEGHDVPTKAMRDYRKVINELALGTVPNYATPPDLGVLGLQVKAVKAFEPGELPSLKQVADNIPAPAAPTGNVKPVLPRPAEGEQIIDHLSTTLAAVYPWRELRVAWHENLSKLPMIPTVVMGVEWQRQEASLDGDWSEPQPVPVTWVPPVDNQGRPYPEVDVTDTANLNTQIDLARQLQTYRLIPQFKDIYVPGLGWQSPLNLMPKNELVSFVDVEAPNSPDGMPSPTPGMMEPDYPPEYYDDMGDMPPEMMPPGYGDTRRPTQPGRRPTQPTRRPPTRRPPMPPQPVVEEQPKTIDFQRVVIPHMEDQMQDGRLLLSMYDDTLKTAVRYRYRVRLLLLNPLMGQGPYVSDPEEASVATVATPWSDWSPEQVQESQTKFYITGHSSAARKLTASVFTHSYGQTVAIENFTVNLGGIIGEPRTVQLKNPIIVEGFPEVREVTADFSTGNIAVRFDFSRRYVRSGSMNAETTAALLYLDKDGELHWKVQADDVNSEEYRELKRSISDR